MEIDVYLALRKYFTVEQLEQIVALVGRLQERALERKCNQQLTIVLDDKGHPRWLNGTDNAEMAKP